MRKNQLNNIPNLKDRRKELRKSPTPAEAVLWELLKTKQLNGKKFRRQHSIGHFIVDFYCPTHKLVIELDGKIHDFSEEYDKERDAILKAYGYTVLRFKNEMVFTEPDRILEEIERYICF